MNIRSVIAATVSAFAVIVAATSSALAADPIPVPEPMTLGLVAAGAAGLIVLRRFRGK